MREMRTAEVQGYRMRLNKPLPPWDFMAQTYITPRESLSVTARTQFEWVITDVRTHERAVCTLASTVH